MALIKMSHNPTLSVKAKKRRRKREREREREREKVVFIAGTCLPLMLSQ